MNKNHPYVHWATTFLWISSVLSVIWSTILFFCFHILLYLTGTDMINGCVLLSGLLLIPSNFYVLYYLSTYKRLSRETKILCCPIWMYLICIMIVCLVGVSLCVIKLWFCYHIVVKVVNKSIKHYRSVPQYKRFMDSIQWTFKCCGLNSYKDWFSKDWYDKIRDYEWDPIKHSQISRTEDNDSVPLSCCKSGSCISNYLSELGTHSINTKGCFYVTRNALTIFLVLHLTLFVIEIVAVATIYKFVTLPGNGSKHARNSRHVRHLMTVKKTFHSTSGSSSQLTTDESDNAAGPIIKEIAMFNRTSAVSGEPVFCHVQDHTRHSPVND